MEQKLKDALNAVEITQDELLDIADGIINEYTSECNELIKEARENIESMNNEYIRQLMIKLSINSYSFSEQKERSQLTAECAEALMKEKLSKEFLAIDGTVALKDKQSTLNSSNEIVANMMYEYIASMLKTKLDEIHRVVDTLKSVLASRMAEAKLNKITDSFEQF